MFVWGDAANDQNLYKVIWVRLCQKLSSLSVRHGQLSHEVEIVHILGALPCII